MDILFLAQVLGELHWVRHVLHDVVVDGIMGSLHAVVSVKCLMNFGWRGAEREEGEDMVADVVVESDWNQVVFLVWSCGLEFEGNIAYPSSL